MSSAFDKSTPPQTIGTRRGNGAGWGGPAKGEGRGGPARGAASHPSKGHSGRIVARREATADRYDALCKILYEIAHDETAPDMLRLHAADKLLDRNEGKPIARIVPPIPDPLSQLSDEELEAERDRVLSRIRAVKEAAAEGVRAS